MEQLLQPSKRTQEPTHKAPQQHAEQDERARDVIGKAELGRAHHRLKCTDRTCARSRRARIAIKPRHANRFFRALVDAAFGEVWQMDIRNERCYRLNESAKSGQNMRRSVFSFIQFRYTPSTA